MRRILLALLFVAGAALPSAAQPSQYDCEGQHDNGCLWKYYYNQPYNRHVVWTKCPGSSEGVKSTGQGDTMQCVGVQD